MQTVLLSLVLLAVAQPLAALDLPAGKVRVDVMSAVSAPRAAELNAKLRDAVQSDPERWTSDLRNAQNAERLGWDERLGLTRDEHAELQRAAGEATLTKTGEAVIDFVRTPDGRVILHPDASLSELTGVVLDLGRDAVETPFGRTTGVANVTAGPWSGTQWTLDVPGEVVGTGTTVKLAYGHNVQDGRQILVYEAKQVEEGKMPRRAKTVIVFP